MGFFADFDPEREVRALPMMQDSALDLIDLHLYGGVGHGLETLVDAFGLSDAIDKPVIMGEFGAFTFAYPSPRVASWELARWQAASCAFGFDGWLVWQWSGPDPLHEVWGARQGKDAIAKILAPVHRPRPCSAKGIPRNVAVGATATASASLPKDPPGFAVDGLQATSWIAGDGPPQSIELDLGTERTIGQIQLLVGQFPDGTTDHRLLVAGGDAQFQLVEEFSGVTADGDWLVFKPPQPIVVRFIRVETESSPSWVSWRDIRAYT